MAKEKVLVIDDEEDACWLVSKILQDNNFSVITAVTGSEGTRELEAHAEEIGLVFLDLRLPDVDGLLLCKIIREKNIPVTIMTAYGNETARKAAKELGVVDFIDKPLKVERILELAREVIGKAAEEKLVQEEKKEEEKKEEEKKPVSEEHKEKPEEAEGRVETEKDEKEELAPPEKEVPIPEVKEQVPKEKAQEKPIPEAKKPAAEEEIKKEPVSAVKAAIPEEKAEETAPDAVRKPEKTQDVKEPVPEKEEKPSKKVEVKKLFRAGLKIPKKPRPELKPTAMEGKKEAKKELIPKEEAKKEPETKKPVISVKFIVLIVIFLLGGGVFYKGKIAVDTGGRFLVRGDYIPAFEWYAKALAINPWNKKAKDGVKKAENIIHTKIMEQMRGKEKLEKQLSEKSRDIVEKNAIISSLNTKIEELNQKITSYMKLEEKLLKEVKNGGEKKKVEELISEKEMIILQNKALVDKTRNLEEEMAKSLHKMELINEESQALRQTLDELKNKFKKEAAEYKKKINELEPYAIRVKAIDEMKGNVKKAREKLFREKMEFMKLKNTRTILREKERVGFRAKEEMELEENPGSEELTSALNFIKTEDYDNACRVLANILVKEPDNEEAKLLLNMVISTSTTEDAGKYFQKLLGKTDSQKQNPSAAAAKPSLSKALEYISGRQYQKAEKELHALLAKEPSNTVAGELILRVRVLKKLSENQK